MGKQIALLICQHSTFFMGRTRVIFPHLQHPTARPETALYFKAPPQLNRTTAAAKKRVRSTANAELLRFIGLKNGQNCSKPIPRLDKFALRKTTCLYPKWQMSNIQYVYKYIYIYIRITYYTVLVTASAGSRAPCLAKIRGQGHSTLCLCVCVSVRMCACLLRHHLNSYRQHLSRIPAGTHLPI